MSKLNVGQKVFLRVPSAEKARERSLHILDEKQELSAEVVYVHKNGNVNVVAYDQVGTQVALLDIESSKPKGDDELYVSAQK